MGTQRKFGTSLDGERQRKLAEIVAEEPLACPSAVLAVSLDVMYRVWNHSGRDLKSALGVIGSLGKPGEKFQPASVGRSGAARTTTRGCPAGKAVA